MGQVAARQHVAVGDVSWAEKKACRETSRQDERAKTYVKNTRGTTVVVGLPEDSSISMISSCSYTRLPILNIDGMST